jgi:signal transduction histidine kinase
LVGILPPVAVLAVVESWATGLPAAGTAAANAVVIGLAFAWAAIVAAVSARMQSAEMSSILQLAERRDTDSAQGAAHDRLAGLLERRDRQLQVLAAETAAAPISRGAVAVALHVVQMARKVTDDATWSLVVHQGGPELPPGVYEADDHEPRAIEDLHRWAATVAPASNGRREMPSGPWGAFLILHLEPGGQPSTLLMAPWEGRATPTGAELTLLTLVAEHAASALDHALLYDRVQRQASELDRLSSVQRDFLRGVTHDLQSPLAAISTIAADLRQRTGPSTDLDTIEEQAQRLRRMVAQLLTMSAIEAGAVTPRTDPMRTAPIVERVMRSMRAAGHEMTVISTGPDHLAIGDPDRLEQVLWAVLDNAVKYSPPGGPVSVVIGARGEGDALVAEVAVTDAGVGMDKATRDHAFDQFYRAEQARSLVPNGSGIGLSTARALMDLMGGTIEIDSELGKGATVRLSLPAETAERPPEFEAPD